MLTNNLNFKNMLEHKETYPFFSFLLAFVFESVGIGQVVDGDSQEDVEEDVVTADEEYDEIQTVQWGTIQ